MKSGIIKSLIIMVSIALAGITGCSTNTTRENTGVGVGVGAVAGGLLGSTIGGGAAIAGGAIVGGLIGGVIGNSMDSSDKTAMNNAMNSPSGQPTHWVNKKTGMSYTVVPTSRVTVNGNPNCRKFYTTAVVKGKRQRVYGVACPTANGTWQAV